MFLLLSTAAADVFDTSVEKKKKGELQLTRSLEYNCSTFPLCREINHNTPLRMSFIWAGRH